MVRNILEWVDRKEQEVIADPETTHSDLAKNKFAQGFVEGFLDSCAVIGAITIALNVANVFKKRK